MARLGARVSSFESAKKTGGMSNKLWNSAATNFTVKLINRYSTLTCALHLHSMMPLKHVSSHLAQTIVRYMLISCKLTLNDIDSISNRPRRLFVRSSRLFHSTTICDCPREMEGKCWLLGRAVSEGCEECSILFTDVFSYPNNQTLDWEDLNRLRWSARAGCVACHILISGILYCLPTNILIDIDRKYLEE